MKKLMIYLFVSLPLIAVFSACSEDDLNPDSIFQPGTESLSEFDQWLYENYVKPYNIQFDYKWNWVESDQSTALIPAELGKAQKMAQFVKSVWMDSYLEVKDSLFIKQYIPKLMIVYGDVRYAADGTAFQAEAAGGVKVHLYGINKFSVADSVWLSYYNTTMHHEYCHILNQIKKMPPDFKTVTEADYLYASYTDSTTSQANRKGFVTQYARKNAMEDFAELYCTYIATDSTQWVNFVDKLTDVYSNTGKTGGQLITEKITIVRNYMLNMFGIDMDELRVIVLRKQKEIGQLKESDFITFK